MNEYGGLMAALSALMGSLVTSFLTVYLPRRLFSPKLRIIKIDFHKSYRVYNLVVVNEAKKTAAINATGRITVIGITQKSIISRHISHSDSEDYGDWKEKDCAFLSQKDWEIGIIAEHVYWATSPHPTKLNLNPQVPERLTVAYSNGPWVDIASENFAIKRARLSLDSGQTYYVSVEIVAENCKPSRPFHFRISLGQDGYAKLEI